MLQLEVESIARNVRLARWMQIRIQKLSAPSVPLGSFLLLLALPRVKDVTRACFCRHKMVETVPLAQIVSEVDLLPIQLLLNVPHVPAAKFLVLVTMCVIHVELTPSQRGIAQRAWVAKQEGTTMVDTARSMGGIIVRRAQPPASTVPLSPERPCGVYDVPVVSMHHMAALCPMLS